MPTFLFINKMDLAGADRAALLAHLKNKLSGGCVDFGGPDTLWEEAAVCDEAALEQYLEMGELPEDMISRLIGERKLFPCYFGSALKVEGVDELLARIDKLLDKGTRRVTIHLPYDKGGLLDMLYREAKVESVEYGETIDIVATCVPRVIGQVKDYIEGYQEPKEDWEE